MNHSQQFELLPKPVLKNVSQPFFLIQMWPTPISIGFTFLFDFPPPFSITNL